MSIWKKVSTLGLPPYAKIRSRWMQIAKASRRNREDNLHDLGVSQKILNNTKSLSNKRKY